MINERYIKMGELHARANRAEAKLKELAGAIIAYGDREAYRLTLKEIVELAREVVNDDLVD